MNAVLDSYAADLATLSSPMPWLATRRQQAFERFAAEGFPTPRQEAWKYTDLARLAATHFPIAPAGGESDIAKRVETAQVGAGHRLVFVDGRYAQALSQVGELPRGVTIEPLAEALAEHPDLVEAHYGEAEDGSALAALNAALATDGAFIRLAPGTSVDRPIHLVFVATTATRASHPRLIFLAEENSAASLIEHYLGACGEPYFTNSVTRIVLMRGAAIAHYKLQEEDVAAYHVADICALQAPRTRFESHSLSFGARLARHDIATRFDGVDCETAFNGLFVAGGNQHVDHHTRIDHAAARGTSREFYRGIVDDKARGIFSGRILVRAGAQQTDARQRSDTLLLSRQAEADARPQLEIYADDVKCAHGATVGQLDEDALFYLRTRGIEAALARDLLTRAFADAALERIPLREFKQHCEAVLLARLPGGDQLRQLP